MSSLWFPDRKLITRSPVVSDTIQDDFAVQARMFGWDSAEYIQLTAGPFSGRIVGADLGAVELFIEYTNQSIALADQPPSVFSFAVLLETRDGFKFCGRDHTMETVSIQGPSGIIDATIGAHGTQMVLAVDKVAMLQSPGLTPEIADWMQSLPERGALIKAPSLAKRLRVLSTEILETASACTSQEQIDALAQCIVIQLCNTLALALMIDGVTTSAINPLGAPTHYRRFEQLRSAFSTLMDQNNQEQEDGFIEREFGHLGSKRLVQKAFTESVGMGPLQYWRLLRLHNVRRKLLQSERLHQTISDIAAEDGFWEPSRFGLHYRRQFGERPSDTRKRLDPGVLSRFRAS